MMMQCRLVGCQQSLILSEMWRIKILSGTSSGVKCHLSEVPPCKNMAHGRFILGAVYKSRFIRGRCKKIWPRQHSPYGVPEAPRNKLTSASRQRPGVGGGTTPWSQAVIDSKQPLGTNPMWWPEGTSRCQLRSWRFVDRFIAMFGIEIGYK